MNGSIMPDKSPIELLQDADYNGNLSLLGSCNKDFVKAINDAAPYKLKLSEDNTLNCVIDDKLVYSETGGMKQIERWVKCWPKDAWLYIVYGFGMGVHIAALLKHIRPYSHIIVIERDYRLLKTAFTHRSCSDIIEPGRVMIIDNADKLVIHERLSSISDSLVRQICVTRPIYVHDAEFRAEATDNIHSFAESTRTGVLTQIGNSRNVFRNMINNLPDYLLAEGIGPLRGRYCGVPAIIVAAGPSVEKQLVQLRLHDRNNYLLISCLTMLKPLLERGIKPDYVTALDYHEVSAKFLDGVKSLEGIDAVFEPKLNYAVTKRWEEMGGNPIYFLGLGWMEALAGMDGPLFERIDGGGTVAHLSLHVAHWLGCSPILSIGYDFCYTDNKYYPECVFEAHKWKDSFRQNPTMSGPIHRVVEDVNGELCRSDEQMQCYHEEFVVAARELEDVEYIDCTEGGAVKPGIVTMPLTIAREKYCQLGVRQTIDLRHPIERHFYPERWKAAKKNLPRLIGILTEMKEVSGESQQLYRDIFADRENEKLLEHTRERLGEIAGKFYKYSKIVELVSAYTGVMPLLNKWMLTQIDMDDVKGKDLWERQAERDTLYHKRLERGCEDLIKDLEKVLEDDDNG